MRTEDRQRWGVVATVDEPAPLLAAFAAHHLSLGAAEVHLYLDRPDPAARALLAGIPGLFVTSCDDTYWAESRRGSRPPRHTARQKANAGAVYRGRGPEGEDTLDWLLHCDADEFAWPLPGVSIGAALAAADAALDFMMLPVAERAYAAPPGTSIFEGVFRLPGAPVAAERAGWLNEGLTGHTAGKGIVRTGRAIEMGVHRPVPGLRELAKAPFPGARLVHFDGLTPLHLGLKLLKRATEKVSGPPRPHGAHRIRQFTAMAAATGDHAAWRALVEGLQQAGGPEGLWPLDPAPAVVLADAIAQSLPGREVDLTPDAFDAALRLREAALIAATGLAA